MEKPIMAAGAMSIFLVCSGNAFGLSTDEMLRLRRCGISEETIVMMVESGYLDAQKVVELKAAGFKEENIRAIIKAESTTGTVAEVIRLQTSARVKILRYLIFRGSPVLQNTRVIENAVLSLLPDARLKLEWKEQTGLGLLDELKRETLKSPFYWQINANVDALASGADGYAYLLRSGPDHKGKPETDASHYWLLYFDPKNTEIIDHIKNAL